MSDILSNLREAVSDPTKAKDTLTGLTARVSDMTEDQRAQAAQLVETLRDKIPTMAETTKAQVNDLLSRLR